MDKVKLAVIYYSATGTNHQLAQWAAESGERENADVKIARAAEHAPASAIESNPRWKEHLEATKDIPAATTEDIDWADAIVFSTPTRYGNVPSQLKQLLDSTGRLWTKGRLSNKVVSAMCSAMNMHGGQEETILSLYTTMYHWGAIVVAPGYTDSAVYPAGGNPYGTSASVDEKGNMRDKDLIREAVFHQAKRTIQVASWVKEALHKNTVAHH